MLPAPFRGGQKICFGGVAIWYRSPSKTTTNILLNLQRLRDRCTSSQTYVSRHLYTNPDPHAVFRSKIDQTLTLKDVTARRIRSDKHQIRSVPASQISSLVSVIDFENVYSENNSIFLNRRHRPILRRFLRKNFRVVCPCAQQCRVLTTKSNSNTMEMTDSAKQNQNELKMNEKEKQSQTGKINVSETTESDFASYLSGEVNQLLDDENKKRSSLMRRRTRSMAVIFGIDKDKEMYEEILKVSYMQKEKARLQTAKNVKRALIGNVVICFAKLGAWISSGSSAMLAEFVHSVVDSGNQALLLVGLHDAKLAPDRKHPYGYGKSVYFWALVSALGTFFLGAGVSMTHAVSNLMNPSLQVITWEVWTVLGISFVADGYVLIQTVRETYGTKPEDVSYYEHLSNIRDPATLAVLLEDGAACLGVVLALGGIALSHATSNPIFDGFAGVAISSLLGAMGIALVRVNHRFLLGQAVDQKITDDIAKILLSRRSIDNIRSIQSQWTGPETFSYKAEVDFDGTYLAAKLMPIYQHEFLQIRDTMDEELQVLLALYAEDVIRTVEREVRHVEATIRKQYPGAEYIELEPMSSDIDRLAIDDNLEAELRRVESDALNRYLKSLRSEANANKPPEGSDPEGTAKQ